MPFPALGAPCGDARRGDMAQKPSSTWAVSVRKFGYW
jgi:hypothetical protein